MKNDKVSIKLSLKTAWLSQILFFFLLYALYLFLYDYSQVRSSAPPKIPLMNLLFEGWVGWQLWNSDSSLHSCMRNEQWIIYENLSVLGQIENLWMNENS